MKTLFFVLALAFYASLLMADPTHTPPSLVGQYTLVPPSTPGILYKNLELKDNGEAVLSARGEKEILTWRLEENILYLNNSGYYLTWERNPSGQWKISLTPAFESSERVYALREMK